MTGWPCSAHGGTPTVKLLLILPPAARQADEASEHPGVCAASIEACLGAVLTRIHWWPPLVAGESG